MKSKFLSLLKDFCLLSLLLLLGCSKDSATESPQLPERPNDVEPLPESVELAEGVVQLNNAQLAFIADIDEGNTQLSFHNSLPEEYLPKVGELLLQMTPTEELPYGFVGRVTRITQQNGNYVVETEAPTLTEVFDKLYTEGEMQSIAETRAKDSEGYYTVSGNMSKTFDKQGITLSGSYNAGIRLNSNPRVAIDKEKQQNKILFGYDTKLDANVTLTIAQKLDFEGVEELGSGVPISKSMGWLPIATYLQPYIVLTASADYGLNLGVTFEGQNSYSVEQNNGLLPTVKRTKENNSIEPSYDVSSKISGECYAGVGLRVEFRLFGRSDMAIGAGADVGAKASGEVGLQLFEDKELSDSLYDLLKENSATITGAARLIAHASLDSSKDNWYQPFAEIEFFKKRYYLLPSFENVSLSEKDGMVSAEATVGRDLLLKADVGIAAWRGNKPSYGKAYPYQFEQEFSHNPITDQFSADDESEYWTYIKIGNFYVKGVKIGEKDKLREMLIKFYHDTGGDNWTRNDNWCSDKPIDEWYGIDYNGKTLQISLYSNNLTGAGDLSDCTALTTLYCYNNQLTSLNISGCTALKELYCNDNQLISLDVSGCTALNKLSCYNNQFSSLDLSGCISLEEFSTYRFVENFPYLKSLNFSGCTNLEEVIIVNSPELKDSQLTSLNVSGCTSLTRLMCSDHQLTLLDISDCTALERLFCCDNQLTSLNTSGCTALEYLECYNNQLTSINVSDCTALKWLYCEQNQLTSLNTSGCTALEYLECYDNQLTSLNVSGCAALRRLECYNNQLTSLNMSDCVALKELYCKDNQLTSLDVSGCTALWRLECYDNQLTSLNVSDCAALGGLYCYNNQLTSLNMSDCVALKELYCKDNQLTSLDVSGCTALYVLSCSGNQLTSLNVSECTAFELLSCSDNQLTSLNVSDCTALTELYCYDNQLTSLNVSGCAALRRLQCDNNQLTSLDVSGCTALTCLFCYDNPITQQITAEFERIQDFIHDKRYSYKTKKVGEEYINVWRYNYSDHHGWYYPNEPKSGYTYDGWDGTN